MVASLVSRLARSVSLNGDAHAHAHASTHCHNTQEPRFEIIPTHTLTTLEKWCDRPDPSSCTSLKRLSPSSDRYRDSSDTSTMSAASRLRFLPRPAPATPLVPIAKARAKTAGVEARSCVFVTFFSFFSRRVRERAYLCVLLTIHSRSFLVFPSPPTSIRLPGRPKERGGGREGTKEGMVEIKRFLTSAKSLKYFKFALTLLYTSLTWGVIQHPEQRRE